MKKFLIILIIGAFIIFVAWPRGARIYCHNTATKDMTDLLAHLEGGRVNSPEELDVVYKYGDNVFKNCLRGKGIEK